MTTNANEENQVLKSWEPAIHFLNEEKNIFVQEILFLSQTSLVLSVLDNKQRESVIKVCPKSGKIGHEARAMSKFHHPNIVSFVTCYKHSKWFFLQMEKVDGKSLVDYLFTDPQREISSLTTKEIFHITKEIVSALVYMKSIGWCHLDLKPDNIIYDQKTQTVKLIDFEFCSRFHSESYRDQKVGTLQYTSPEVKKGHFEGPEADVWSLGITLYVMFTGRFPFSDKENFLNPINLDFSDLPKEFAPLIKRMLETKKHLRITIEELAKQLDLTHKYKERSQSSKRERIFHFLPHRPRSKTPTW